MSTTIDSFYSVILQASIKDMESCLRMLSEVRSEDGVELYPPIIPIKSSLRRAISDAKDAIRSFEE